MSTKRRRFTPEMPHFGGAGYKRRRMIKQLEKNQILLNALSEEDPKAKAKPKKRLLPPRSLLKARKYLKEMVATPSIVAIYITRLICNVLWNRIFNGIEVQGLEQIQDAGKDSTVLFVPCHRSHLDYVLVSYVLDHHRMAVPHIVAGNNLNMFGVGRILKMGGAMFIRRIFKGQPLYAATFMAYLFTLLNEGYPVEFFIEGGRSRTGKNLPPKTGIMSMLVQYIMDNQNRDLTIVPVSIVYERLMEENSYVKELGGLPKRKESLGDLLKAYRLWNLNFGKVFVTFAKPFSLRERCHAYLSQAEPDTEFHPKTPQFQQMVHGISMEIIDLINIYTRTSLVPILTTAMLSETRQGFRRDELLEKGKFLTDLYLAHHPRAETAIHGPDKLQEVIDFLLHSGNVGYYPDKRGDIYYFEFQHKLTLNIYKNNIIHHFVIPSVLAFQLENSPQSIKSLLEHTLYFDHLFRYEFMFPRSYDFRVAIDTFLDFALRNNLIRKSFLNYQVVPESLEKITILSRILLPFREAFHVAVYTLTQSGLEYPVGQRALVKEMQDVFVKLHLLGRIETRESNIVVTYRNIIRFLQEEGYLQAVPGESERPELKPGARFAKIDQLEEWLLANPLG